MTRPTPILAALFAMALAAPAFAQDTTTPPATGTTPPATDAPPTPVPDVVPSAEDLSLGREEDPNAIGATYTAAMHGDWEQRCVRTENGADPCQMYQLMRDGDQNPVAEITIVGLPAGQQAVAGATVIVPLETLLTQELTMQVDSAAARKYPFAWCSPVGCIARIGFTAPEIAAMKRGNAARITIVPVVAPDQKVTVTMSLKGFTAGLDAVNKANGT
jgi:invasion protein IalB